MQEILTLLAGFSAVFAAGYLAARLFSGGKSIFRKNDFEPVENAKVRMKSASALYRCRLISHGPDGWVFSAPMQRDSYVPIPVGEVMTCEVIGKSGVMTFQTAVIARRSKEGVIVVSAPKNVNVQNRREGNRREGLPMEVMVGGKSGSVMDLSPGGARVKIKGFEKEGNSVRIDLPSGESRGATVVDARNDFEGSVIRLRFDEPIRVPNE